MLKKIPYLVLIWITVLKYSNAIHYKFLIFIMSMFYFINYRWKIQNTIAQNVVTVNTLRMNSEQQVVSGLKSLIFKTNISPP